MGAYFTRERFRGPQFLAVSILAAFLAQSLWLVHAELSQAAGMGSAEAIRIEEGLKQWRGHGVANASEIRPAHDPLADWSRRNENGFEVERSPLLYLLSSAPLLAWPHPRNSDSAAYWRWLPRIPFLACGLFLGASLWYVARRLCGNTGGFIALTLYGFSPSFLQSAAAWHVEPHVVAAWGAFGTIFTAIAVAHTLYAPREVVLWNWRRIVLLGVALAIAVGAQFSMIVLLPMALGFLLYVAPIRRRAATVIWMASCAVGFFLFLGTYFFHLHAFRENARHAVFWAFHWNALAALGSYQLRVTQIGWARPAFVIILPVTLSAYLLWPRTRYFGNTAPLLVAVLFLVLAIANPRPSGDGFLLAAIPFLFVFVAGVLADLLEVDSPYRPAIRVSVLVLLLTYIAQTLVALAEVPRG